MIVNWKGLMVVYNFHHLIMNWKILKFLANLISFYFKRIYFLLYSLIFVYLNDNVEQMKLMVKIMNNISKYYSY